MSLLTSQIHVAQHFAIFWSWNFVLWPDSLLYYTTADWLNSYSHKFIWDESRT